jgi:cation diffusion facilitator family transporter
MAEREARLRAGIVSAIVGVVVFAGKLAAWWVTDSAAVLSDALESVVNVVAAAVLLFSLIVAARPADRSHPYGHGKVEFFSAGVEGTLIAIAAVLILGAAIRDLVEGSHLRSLDVGLLLVSTMTVANAGLGAYLLRVGRRTHSLALQADGHHVLTDVWTSAGVIAGLAAVWITGLQWLDPLVAIAVALNILRTGWMLVRQAIAGLMDEADEELLDRMVAALEQKRSTGWLDVHSLRTFRSGAFHHADLHLVVPRYFDAQRLHDIDDALHVALADVEGWHGELIVHFDPCAPPHCPGCAMEACPVRAHAFVRQEPFDLDRATREDDPLLVAPREDVGSVR